MKVIHRHTAETRTETETERRQTQIKDTTEYAYIEIQNDRE